MKRILVTGATGLLGRHSLPALQAREFQVHAARRQTPVDEAAGVVWHQADLLDPVQVRRLLGVVRPEYLLHLAWITTPGVFWTSPENLRWAEASLCLLRMFQEHGGRRVVITGSCAEYDCSAGYCREDRTPLAPATLYGACKHAVHLASSAFSRQAGMSLAWARVFFLYGPWAHRARFPAAVISSLLDDQPALCSSGVQIRDFLHAADAGSALAAIVDSEVEGPVNVASGQPTRIADVARMAADLVGRPHLLRLGALGTSGSNGAARTANADEPPLLVGDPRRLIQEVGWRPQFDLPNGLAQTIEWWKARKAGHVA